MKTGLIIVEELIKNSKIEPSFIVLLENEGLINITVEGGKQCIHESQLSDLELFVNLHYELSINIEGIDVIRNLLRKMSGMEQELHDLRKLLHYHRSLWSDLEE